MVRAINVLRIISRRRDADDPCIDALLHRLPESVTSAVGAETHIDYFNLVGVLQDVLQPLDHGGNRSYSGIVQNLDGPEPGSRGHTDHTDIVVESSSNAGDMGPMPVAIIAGTVVGAKAHMLINVQVRVGEIDSGVQNCDIDVHGFINPVDLGN